MTDTNSKIGILYVDDEDKALKYFSRAFEEEFLIFTASSVSEAKEILGEKSSKIGLLISDQRMPEEKGVELLKYARKEYPEIIRVLTTAYSDLDDAIEAVNNGEIFRYITKPWNIASLKLELRQSIQFFELRRERNQLMREKISTWQRLEGVNRVRDLLMISSSISQTKGATQAIQSFIEQIPTKGQKEPAEVSFDSWGLLKSELSQMIEVSGELQGVIANAAAGNCGETIDIAKVVKDSCPSFVNLGSVEEVSLESGDKSRIDAIFSNLCSWISSRFSEGKLQIEADSEYAKICFEMSSSDNNWGEDSILNIPVNLLSAFLLSYDQGGFLELGQKQSGAFSIELKLPMESKEVVDAEFSTQWLDRILTKFENW
ncbi:response regulator [Puniceicoccaceae bacterium K14]|nr:response regulator [Puniceicoccaceae bacterium K14]